MSQTRLDKYDNSWFNPGGSGIKRLFWYYCNIIFLKSSLFPVSGLKVALLRVFGATIGKGVVIKPHVNIKYPWLLTIGDYCWIGENVWIDNLGRVTIGNHVCLSQGAMLLTGNHNYKRSTFDLMVEEIVLEDGVWIGALSLVCPGVICRSHAVLSAHSVATTELLNFTVYSGNPAKAIREREIS
jgi:putative colanic acid biosynthesis acetyltransferase WcaF